MGSTILAPVQGLRAPAEGAAAALYQADSQRPAGKFAGNGDAGCARADNTQVRFDVFGVGQLAGVSDHDQPRTVAGGSRRESR